MDGLECTKKIRELYQGRKCYITMVTGAFLDPELILGEGVDHILQKPLDLKALNHKLCDIGKELKKI